jgi:predicted DNA-binding transcriptional regulator AlpA
MNISEIIKQNPKLVDNLVLKITGDDLKEFALICFEEGRKDVPPAKPTEELLTTEQFAEKLKVSKVTLWHWDKKGITMPLRIGNAKRYRRSDLEKLMNQ